MEDSRIDPQPAGPPEDDGIRTTVAHQRGDATGPTSGVPADAAPGPWPPVPVEDEHQASGTPAARSAQDGQPGRPATEGRTGSAPGTGSGADQVGGASAGTSDGGHPGAGSGNGQVGASQAGTSDGGHTGEQRGGTRRTGGVNGARPVDPMEPPGLDGPQSAPWPPPAPEDDWAGGDGWPVAEPNPWSPFSTAEPAATQSATGEWPAFGPTVADPQRSGGGDDWPEPPDVDPFGGTGSWPRFTGAPSSPLPAQAAGTAAHADDDDQPTQFDPDQPDAGAPQPATPIQPNTPVQPGSAAAAPQPGAGAPPGAVAQAGAEAPPGAGAQPGAATQPAAVNQPGAPGQQGQQGQPGAPQPGQPGVGPAGTGSGPVAQGAMPGQPPAGQAPGPVPPGQAPAPGQADPAQQWYGQPEQWPAANPFPADGYGQPAPQWGGPAQQWSGPSAQQPHYPIPGGSDQAPTADDFAQRRAARPSDPVASQGVRRAVRVGTFGLMKLGPGRKEQEQRHAVEMVRRNFGGLRQITVINPKGGAGKTVAVLMIAMTFGQKRGGYVLAWDNNETQGTLGMRAAQDFHNRTVRDLLRDLAHFRGPTGRVGDLSQYVRAQGEAMFDVLASDESATAGEMLTSQAFHEIREVVSRFYKLIVVDTGNNVRAANWQSAIDATDQLVVCMSARNDSAETAARALDHLEQTGRHDLVRRAVTVVSMPAHRKDLDLPAVQRHFSARTRAVLLAPYEKLLDSGEPIRYAGLSQSSRDAWLKIAAAVAEGL